MNVSWHDDKMRLSDRSHTQLRAPRSGKIAWGLWVITICRSILFDEHHRHGSTEQHWQARRRSTHLEYDPFLFPNSPALWHCWEMMAQSSKARAGTYNKHHYVNPPPCSWGRDNVSSAGLHKSMEHTKQRQTVYEQKPTPRRLVCTASNSAVRSHCFDQLWCERLFHICVFVYIYLICTFHIFTDMLCLVYSPLV